MHRWNAGAPREACEMSPAKLTANPRTMPFARDDTVRLVVFRLDEHRYALPLSAVERIVRAVAITPLPKAPAVIMGVIDVAGRLTPVMNMRRRFKLAERPLAPAQQFAIVHAVGRTVALVIDEAVGVIEGRGGDIVQPSAIAPGLEQLRGVVQLKDGMVLIHDIEQFLSLEETRALDDALERESAGEL